MGPDSCAAVVATSIWVSYQILAWRGVAKKQSRLIGCKARCTTAHAPEFGLVNCYMFRYPCVSDWRCWTHWLQLIYCGTSTKLHVCCNDPVSKLKLRSVLDWLFALAFAGKDTGTAEHMLWKASCQCKRLSVPEP